jgi:5-(carboxyamino)imidazole ribonucleotide synthase
VTVEFELIPASVVASLAKACRVAPGAEAIAIAQDRLREKRFLRAIGLPVVPFVEVLAARDLESAGCYPGILKSARNGYDGRGQCAVASSDAAREAWRAFGEVPCVLERRMPLDREVSVIVARGADGAIRTFPLAENRHRDGILELSVAPARVPAALSERAAASAASIAEHLGYVGVLGVEFFVSKGELIVNEFAPRPHNSGHYTIEACATSQFEQQVRSLCGLPLGETTLRRPAAMANILGDAWRRGEPDFGWLRSTAGHVTFLGERSGKLAERALRRLNGARNPATPARRAPTPAAHLSDAPLNESARNVCI